MDTMHDTIEHITTDLYTIDPSLKERDTEVRAIIKAFMAQRPTAEIDPTFMYALRRDILAHEGHRNQPSPWSAWFVHLAPVGVAAILMLMLVPGIIGPQPVPEVVEVAEPSITTSSEMATEEGADDTFAKRSGNPPTDDISLMHATGLTDTPGDSFTLPPQLPGNTMVVEYASLTAPGFLAIERIPQTGSYGEIIGVTPLLPIGVTNAITVPLTTLTTVDEIFYVSLYPDNGDERFTEEDRAPYVAGTQEPLRTLVSVVAPTNVPRE